ncbi:MAG: DUF975 family protein [Clostridia bacterium]|nr:DUF975 family protein [Clostridia bacterium]
MSSSSQLRAKAREMLGGQIFGSAWLYPLLVCLIVSAISGLASAIVVGSLIVTGPLAVGSAFYFLNIARKKEGASGDIGAMLKPVSGDAGGTIILGLLTTLFTILWSLLFIIPGIIKSFSYAMAPYIKADHPEYTATQALDESRRIMNGNKWRLFCLNLSFIGWLIVGALACGIGTLWVAPYMSAAQAAFYEEIKNTPAQA